MKNQFWTGLGSRAVLVKEKIGRLRATFEACFFMFSWAKDKLKILGSIFYGGKTRIFEG
jgi:hypothetical protein